MSYSAACHQGAIKASCRPRVVHLSYFGEISAELFQNSPPLTDCDLDDGQDTNSRLHQHCKEELLSDDGAEYLTRR